MDWASRSAGNQEALMQQFVRWGILGAANFARKQMAPAIHAASHGVLAAIASGNREKTAAFSDTYPGLRVHNDYDALLADDSIDAVYIPLPNHLHIEWSLKAISAGKHVLCEKPIALQASDIEALIRARDSASLLVAEAYMILHHPQWYYARDLLQQGRIGKLQHIDSVFTYYKNEPDNIRSKADMGGGGIRDIGIYCYGSARFVTGEEPDAIRHTHIILENEVDIYAQVLASFPTFHLSAVNSMRMAEKQAVTLHGTEGMIHLPAPFNPGIYADGSVELHQAGKEVHIRRFTGMNQYINQVENFNRSILDGRPYPCPLEFSLGSQRMMDRVFAHHRDSSA